VATLLLLGCSGGSSSPSGRGADASSSDAVAPDRAAPDLAAPDRASAPEAAVDLAAGTADQSTGIPRCQLRFSHSTANITAATVPVADSCPGERTDDGMGHPFIDFQPGDMQAGVVRTFSIWQFETRAPAGTVLRIEDGFDEVASRGVSVRYLELAPSGTNTWRADRGTVRLLSTRDEAYTLELVATHLVPAVDPFGANHASGELEVNGTVVSALP
jgi:hypothetical protein